MSMIAKETGNLSIEKLEAGVYTGISSMLVDLGLQESEKFEKTQRKMLIIWDIVDEYIEINGEKLPRTITKEYGFSLGEKSNLRKDLQAWRGKPFTEEELQGFNLLNILNKPCQLQIILEEKNGKKYNNIASIMALGKGMQIAPLEETCHFDLEDEETFVNWGYVPRWVQEKIKKAQNYTSSGLESYVKDYEAALKEAENFSSSDIAYGENYGGNVDDLPF